jgi:multidrug efflux pump subunit AcrA (membrane-fusion protein)
MKTWLIVFVLLAALGGLIFWRFTQKAQGPAQAGGGRGRMRGPASVELTTPQYRNIVNVYRATGTVEAIQNVKIAARMTAQILRLTVREGDRVRAGQELVRLDASELDASVRQAQANVAEAKYRLAQAQLNQSPADTAVQTQIRQQQANVSAAESDLRQAQSAQQAQTEATKATLEEAQSKIESAQAVVANAAALMKSAQANLENATTKYNRVYGLYQQGYIAAQDVDDAKTTVSVQQATVETAKGQWQAAGAALASV